MQPFRLLADPGNYVACDWDLAVDPAGRAYWVDLFKSHFELILKMGTAARTTRGEDRSSVASAADRARVMLSHNFLDPFLADPSKTRAQFGPITILTLDSWRDESLRTNGFVDAFIDLKARENALALQLLPLVIRQLDALEGLEQFRAVIEGIFAGNIFDMGSQATAHAFVDSSPDFFATREKLPHRPWLIDDFDVLARRILTGPPHRKAIFFIDNAGSDFLLGAVPMMRYLARRGTNVVIAANQRPTLNDMTHADVQAWWPRILDMEPTLAGLPITSVSTGTGEPLIDLSKISADLNHQAQDADLVILEGMGRGVESNLAARFSVDSINLAMVKDEAVAKRIGGKLFDVVCRFR